MKVQNVASVNYQKQQGFGALKIKNDQGLLNIPWGFLTQHKLQNSSCFGMDEFMQVFTIFPTKSGSNVEKEIMTSVGSNAESISILEARKLVERLRKFKGKAGKDAKAPF